MVLLTVLILLVIYFTVIFQYINFYREEQYQYTELKHFYQMKSLVNLTYRRNLDEKGRLSCVRFNIGYVDIIAKKEEWCFDVHLNTGETRRFYEKKEEDKKLQEDSNDKKAVKKDKNNESEKNKLKIIHQ